MGLRRYSLVLLAIVAGGRASAAITPADLELVRWPDASTTFSEPVAVRAPPGDERVFVVERCDDTSSTNTTGHIRIVKNGAVLPTPFLSIAVSCTSEQGVLGLAFDPQFASNRTFYVTYTATGSGLGASQDQVLARYTASAANADVANPTGTVILRVPDIADNHNGGDLHFDPQGYLNWSMGDGGVQNDPNGFAQCTGRKKADNNPASCHTTTGTGPTYYLLGKIIRLDVHATTASAPANFCGAAVGQPAPYAIPPGNPFRDVASHPQECAEIFNWGFRNPYRFSFDRETGDLLIGDVGQVSFEEIDFQAAGSAGRNFQWNACEGTHTFNPSNGSAGGSPCAGPTGSVPPKLDYSHGVGCAVSGGYMYRGPIVALRGQYIFSDYCSGGIYIVGSPGAGAWTFETLAGTPSMNTYGFGQDAQGNLYVTDGAGEIYRFYSASGNDLIFADGFD